MCLGGIIVDGGAFDWKGGKHPLYDEPDNSYGGLVSTLDDVHVFLHHIAKITVFINTLFFLIHIQRWGHDLPEALAPLAYKLRALTVPLRNLGACISPDNSWSIIQGIETLSLRMERHCENAQKVAEHLQAHSKVAWIRFPGLPTDSQHEKAKKYLKGKGGAMVVFGLKTEDPTSAGKKFIDSLQLFSHVASK